MDKKVVEIPVTLKRKNKKEIVKKAVSLEACQYERNFGLTQCGCAT